MRHRLITATAASALALGVAACGEDVANEAGQAADKAGKAAGQAADKAEKAADKAGKAADKAAEKAGKVAGKAEDQASDAAGKAKDAATGAAQRVKGGKLTVVMTDYEFAPSAVSAKAGRLEVTASNEGSAPHEFVLLRTDKAPDAVGTGGGKASEQGLVGEIEEQQPGSSATQTFRVKAGKYVYVCNVGSHYGQGMHGALTVR